MARWNWAIIGRVGGRGCRCLRDAAGSPQGHPGLHKPFHGCGAAFGAEEVGAACTKEDNGARPRGPSPIPFSAGCWSPFSTVTQANPSFPHTHTTATDQRRSLQVGKSAACPANAPMPPHSKQARCHRVFPWQQASATASGTEIPVILLTPQAKVPPAPSRTPRTELSL